MYSIFRTASFKKQYKKLDPQDKELVKKVITLLAENRELKEKYQDHKLVGSFKDLRRNFYF